LPKSDSEENIIEFYPYGYDERQYCSPGFNMPVGLLTRALHGKYAEYHSSADNLDFVKADYLQESYEFVLAILDIIENNQRYVSLNPKCEPQLGKRGLYQKVGGLENPQQIQMAMLWVLNLSDGNHTLLDIAERSNTDFEFIKTAADLLVENQLISATAD
jgi:aminopeptidase-like protein